MHFIIIANMRLSGLTIGLAALVCVLATLSSTAYALPERTMDPTPPATPIPGSPQTHAAHWWHRPEISNWTARLIYFDVVSAVGLLALYVRIGLPFLIRE